MDRRIDAAGSGSIHLADHAAEAAGSGRAGIGSGACSRQASTSFSEEKEAKRLFTNAGVGIGMAKAQRNQKFFGYFFSKK
jgi:hypothetical protein